jgi:5-oxoprolinase (ATP-hydrolysing)
MPRMQPPREFWIDVGGTFTDCIARRPDGTLATHKLLSTGAYLGAVAPGASSAAIRDPARRNDPPAFFDRWRLSLLRGTSQAQAAPIATTRVVRFDPPSGTLHLDPPLPAPPPPGTRYALDCGREAPLIGIHWLRGTHPDTDPGPIEVRLGTTRGTTALLERRGARTALLVTAGFADVLAIGYQSRPRLFDLHIRKPKPLYEAVVEIAERIDARGCVLQPLDVAAAAAQLSDLRRRGIESVAICLLNSYRNPAHEAQLAALARAAGFECVAVSTDLAPLQRIVPRGDTTVVDAYLQPVIRDYLAALRAALPQAHIQLMTSSGALVSAAAFVAKDSLLSGPAGGVVGCSQAARRAGFDAAIGFDMGGTSTDVSRWAGRYERRYETPIEDRGTGAALRIAGEMLAIETVAAGGGSICDFDGFRPTVGPASAAADPGPACYGRGGPLCVTDCNLWLGRIAAAQFPFPLDRSAVSRRLDEQIARIAAASGRFYSPDELAAGYLAIANAHMAAAIARISVQRGYDPRAHVLVSFGGAGGQHACAVADELCIGAILIHPLASVLSAYGIGQARITRFAARDVGRPLDEAGLAHVDRLLTQMRSDLTAALAREGRSAGEPEFRTLLELRYAGQETALPVEVGACSSAGAAARRAACAAAFESRHQALYGFAYPQRPIEIRAARVEALAAAAETPSAPAGPVARAPRVDPPADLPRVEAVFGGVRRTVPLVSRERLHAGTAWRGPLLVSGCDTTIVVEPGWAVQADDEGNLLLWRAATATPFPSAEGPGNGPAVAGPITLELFSNRFAAIADQMGETLRRAALSTNVKERLDFSCALFDAAGGLVAHAAHIPVHVGAIGACVRELLAAAGRGAVELRPRTAYVTNDPFHGGSHLPDITVVTPVFVEPRARPAFFVANRAHHAEIGGIAPGSMPAASRTLADEGVLIPLTAVALEPGSAGGALRIADEGLRELLTVGPHPSRDPDANLADLHAQIAANQRGAAELALLAAHHGPALLAACMSGLQREAEQKLRTALRAMAPGRYAFRDQLDDGAPLVVTIDIADGAALIDFSGTGPVRPDNLNATPAIVVSAVLYCFRCLIGEDLPLNAGVLAPLTIRLPECFLNPPADPDPARCAAVAAGNVETSQRIVDVVLGALGAAAASQGTMNNLAFGDARFGYYETICGGAGAGPTFAGADAVHTHMTNTRLTDVEVLEERYPVRVRRFAIRRGAGGAGYRRGGDGVIRELEFLAPLEVSLVTQRRTVAPYGLAGGAPGACGRNILVHAGTRIEEPLGSLCSFSAEPGDVLRIETPGGGGYGQPRTD